MHLVPAGHVLGGRGYVPGARPDGGGVATLRAMASAHQIRVGGIAIGGRGSRRRPVDDAHEDARRRGDDRADRRPRVGRLRVVRVAVPKREDAKALPLIVRLSPIPVIADIHFNASLALKAIDAGVHAVRINPGNIGGPDKTEQVVRAASARGPRCGSAPMPVLPKHLEALAREDTAEALVVEALERVEILERLDYRCSRSPSRRRTCRR